MATFRLDSARAGASDKARALVEELCQSSPEFAAMWLDHEVRNYGEGTKHIEHPQAGALTLEYSSFSLDDRPDLAMVIYTPSTPADIKRIRSLMAG